MSPALLVGGGLVILVLAAYAAHLHWRLYQLKKARQARMDVGHAEPAASGTRSVELGKAIYLLADALLDDKLTHTEGCLRICALAANLETRPGFREEFGVLFRVAEATAHIPILDAWQALDRKEKQRLDRERMAIEARYADAVLDAARRIKDTMPLL